MNPVILVNLSRDNEVEPVKRLAARLGDSLIVISNKTVGFASTWRFPNMDKTTVNWTRRFLVKFSEQKKFDSMIKIDPDTAVHSTKLPLPPDDCDVAGDFRRSNAGWIWFGAYQFLTRDAARAIVNDPEYTGNCPYQDMALARAVIRQNLRAYNMAEVDGWCSGPTAAVVTHPGRNVIQRLPVGFVNFNQV